MKTEPTKTGPTAGPTESDNLCKRLAELYPEQFAEWIFGTRGVTVQKTELSREPIRADAVILAHGEDETHHIEFQTTPKSAVPLPLRMLDYYVGLKRQDPTRRIRQALVLLTPSREPVPDQYVDERTVHGYDVIRLWEVDPAELLQYEGLLPLATLCRADAGPEALLREVAERVQQIEEPPQQRETLNACRVFAGLKYNKDLVNRLLKENDMLEESVIYQDIFQRGEVRGEARGEERGEERGLQQGLQHQQQLVLRLLERVLGKVPWRARRQIEKLGFEQLALLGESLLDFKSDQELSTWLKQHKTRGK